MNAKKIIGELMKQAGDSRSSHSRNSHSKSSGMDVKSMLGGGGGALGMLLGSKRGRGMGGKALKYGALAKVGSLAWKAWQDHKTSSQSGDASREGEPFEQLQGQAQERRGLEILQAMIMAARADGHIDEAERAQITEQIESMGADAELHAWVEKQFQAPLDAQDLARQADSPQAAREIYLTSVAIIDDQNPMERAWLNQLAQALQLESTMVAELERQASANA